MQVAPTQAGRAVVVSTARGGSGGRARSAGGRTGGGRGGGGRDGGSVGGVGGEEVLLEAARKDVKVGLDDDVEQLWWRTTSAGILEEKEAGESRTHLPLPLRIQELVVASLDPQHDLEVVGDGDVALVVVRREAHLGRAVGKLKDAIELPSAERVEEGRSGLVGRCAGEEGVEGVIVECSGVVGEDGEERLLRILVLDAKELETLRRLVSSELAAGVDCGRER